MSTDQATNHEMMIEELAAQFAPILERSPDGVYIWLDETHKVCNERLARLFGYSVEEWVEVHPFLECFVAAEDRGVYSWNYHQRVAGLQFPVTFRFRGVRKDGSTFAAETDMVPITHRGHVAAYHFVREVGE